LFYHPYYKYLKINGKDIHSVVKEIKKYIHLEGNNEIVVVFDPLFQ